MKEVINIRINRWSKLTKRQKSKYIKWLETLVDDLKKGINIADKFIGRSN